MEQFDYTVQALKNFDDAVTAVQARAQENGFSVLHIQDVKATLCAKGFDRDPLKIIEICNAKSASQLLEKNVKISLMLPCPISVYVEKGKTYICALRPRMVTDLYPGAEIKAIADEVDRAIIKIVDEAKKYQ